MKLIINEVEYNVDLTEHDTTQDEQLEVFFDELDEFKEAYDECVNLPYDDYKQNVVQECIDSIKSLAKWFKNMDRYEAINSHYDIHYAVEKLNNNIQLFKAFKDHENGILLLNSLAWFLNSFCIENDLNLTEQFKINNDKTNGRGTKKKVYLSDDEIIDMIEATNRLLSCGFPESSQKLQNIIDKIEGFGDDVDELLKMVED